MLALTIAALLASSDPQLSPAAQVPPAPQVAPQSAPTDLEDIEVIGRPLETMIRDFVNEVAAPNRHRGIARWKSGVCIGVVNLRQETAQYILDRVSTVASDVGLNAGQPGCTPNVVVIAAADADALSQSLVRDRRAAFRMGGAGMDQGGDALERFVASDKPVRWWQVSMPVDSETGDRATRVPGECSGSCAGGLDYAPNISIFAASRLSSQIVDELFRTIIVLDVDQVSQVSAQQLADYIAFIALAQIDPRADTSGYASILNVFDDPEGASTLTNWDIAYLNGLYDAQRTRANLRSGRKEIADSIQRAHGRLQRAEQD